LQSQPQYADKFPNDGTYTCVSFSVDLRRVCDPQRSLFSFGALAQANYGCECLQGLRPCPPQDLSALQGQALFISPTMYSPPADIYCRDAGQYTFFSAATADGTGNIRWTPRVCAPPPPPPHPVLPPKPPPARPSPSLPSPPRPPPSPPPGSTIPEGGNYPVGEEGKTRPPILQPMVPPPWAPRAVNNVPRAYKLQLTHDFYGLQLDQAAQRQAFEADFVSVISLLAQVDPSGEAGCYCSSRSCAADDGWVRCACYIVAPLFWGFVDIP
jgi:hypothetical protein